MTVVKERIRPSVDVNAKMAMGWRLKGSCIGSDPRTFYPPPEDDSLAEQAKAICGMCPVIVQCREFALSTREKHGVWGGLTERERRRVLRQRRKSA